MSQSDQSPPDQSFIRLFMAHEKQIFRYILSILPHPDDAQDILQETAIALYNKIDAYDQSRPFLPWAFRFAYHMTLKHREKSARWHRFLDDDLIAEISSRRQDLSPELDHRREFLKECLATVPAPKKSLLADYYFEGLTIEQISEKTGKSVDSIYKALQRVRKTLMHCIEGKMQPNVSNA